MNENDMDKVRENLWIGNEEAAANIEALKKAGITAVLNVAWDVNDPVLENKETGMGDFSIRQIKVALRDHSDNKPYMKDIAVNTLKYLLLNDEKVLVHCAAGISRSAYVAVRATAELEGKSLGMIFSEFNEKRPQIVLGPLFTI